MTLYLIIHGDWYTILQKKQKKKQKKTKQITNQDTKMSNDSFFREIYVLGSMHF